MNQIDLGGRCGVVTGGASGLGYAIACRLQQSGCRVVLWDLMPAAPGTDGSLQGFETVRADVSDPSAVAEAVIQTKQLLPKIDILVNNAGISGLNATLWNYPVAEWDKVMRVNLDGVFLCSRGIVPLMLQQNYGRIVNIASVAGKEGNPNASAYSASKAAIIALTKSLGKELADKNIRVNCITPAAVETPLFAQMSKSHVDYMLSKIPLGRFGTVEEVAGLVSWMCSEECSFSTGAVFDLSGGRSSY